MKKTFALLLCAALMLGMTAAAAETLTGTADGFNGPVSVALRWKAARSSRLR